MCYVYAAPTNLSSKIKPLDFDDPRKLRPSNFQVYGLAISYNHRYNRVIVINGSQLLDTGRCVRLIFTHFHQV